MLFKTSIRPYYNVMSYMIEMGDPILRQKASFVDDVFSNETKQTIDKMMSSLVEQKGIGIAAPQVGEAKQIFIVDPNQELSPPYDHIETGLIVFNPSISFLSRLSKS